MTMPIAIHLTVNGRAVEREVPARRSLADFLRDDLGLTGTHLGCEHGVCGACTVLVDGQSARSCLLFAVQPALLEEFRYDADGQLLTSTFMDYLKPTALDVPDIEVDRLESPSPFTTLGSKGVGEGGSIPGPAAVANAVEDALAPFGVVIRSLPITPERVWRWLG